MSPALALLPPIPDERRHAEQPVFEAQRAYFAPTELAPPTSVWRACGLRPPTVRAHVLRPPPRRRAHRAEPTPLEPIPGQPPLRGVFMRRFKSLSIRATKLTRAELRDRAELQKLDLPSRPRNYHAECSNMIRPCPFFTCERHLKFDITNSGSLKDNFPGVELHEMEETCLNDVTEQGPQTIQRLGNLFNLTEHRSEQLVKEALAEMNAKLEAFGIYESAAELLTLLHLSNGN